MTDMDKVLLDLRAYAFGFCDGCVHNKRRGSADVDTRCGSPLIRSKCPNAYLLQALQIIESDRRYIKIIETKEFTNSPKNDR